MTRPASRHGPSSHCLVFTAINSDIERGYEGIWPKVFLLDNHLSFTAAYILNLSSNQFTHRITWSSPTPCCDHAYLYTLENFQIDDLLDFALLPFSADAIAGERICGDPDGLATITCSEPITIPNEWMGLEKFPLEKCMNLVPSQRQRLRLRQGFLGEAKALIQEGPSSLIYEGISFDSFYRLLLDKGYYTLQDLEMSRNITT